MLRNSCEVYLETRLKQVKIIFLFLSLTLFASNNLLAQFNFKIDTVFFKNQYVNNVSLGLDTNVWVIKNANRREVGLVNSLALALDLSSTFQSYTTSSFTDILGLDTLTALVGTNNDYILRFKSATGFTRLNTNFGLRNNKINSLVYIKNTYPINFDVFPNGRGVMTGTDKGLYVSFDFFNFQQWGSIDARYIARSSYLDYFLFDMDTTTIASGGFFINDYNYIISDGIYVSGYSPFLSPSLADSETVNSSMLASDPLAFNISDRFIYYGSNHGLKKRKWDYRYTIPSISYLPNRTVYKLYEMNYFPSTSFHDYYIFLGTDSGLYCNRPSYLGTDSITLVPNTSQYKIMDIDGNICDNSLWLATDKGLVRLLLNYSPNLTFIRKSIKQSLFPKDTITFCKTNTVYLSTSVGDQFQWLKDGIPITGEKNRYYNTNVPGSYQLVITNSFCNYHISDTTFATVLQYDSAVNVDFYYQDTIFKCHGETQELTKYYPSTDYSYEWYKNGFSMNKSSTTITVSENGFYKVKVFNCNGISKFTDSVYVIFDSIPTPTVYHPFQNLCAGIPLKLSIINYPYNISWFKNGSEIISSRNSTNLVVTSSGMYKAMYTDKNQCFRYTEISLVFNDLPDLSIQTNKSLPVCVGDSIKLSAISSASIYNWSNGANDASIYTGTPGLYKITVVSPLGCYKSDSISIYSIQGPSVSLGTDTAFCEGELIPMVLKAGPGFNRYVWDYTTTTDSTYNALTAGYHTVTVYDGNDCQASDTIFINNNCIPLIFPNLITPNGDGRNETFFIQNLIPECSLTISNRWGNLIYNSDNYNNKWDGGNHSDGVYYYVLKSNYYKHEWKGWLEIIK